jgi:hypothetical protein
MPCNAALGAVGRLKIGSFFGDAKVRLRTAAEPAKCWDRSRLPESSVHSRGEPMEEDTAAPSPRLGQSLDASPVASISGDMRDAWSCPLPNEVFEVGSQGQDEDIAGLGVAIALGKLLSAGCTPVRQVSHTADPLPLCLSPH